MSIQRADTPKASILIVDDTPNILRLLSQMLTGQGYEVQTVTSGARALAAARARPPDLILLDIMMPEMDGYEVCLRLKAAVQTRDIPIIFISAIGETKDKVKAFTIGGVDYVTKPFQVKEVLARVATHLSLWALQKQLQAANDELARQLEELQARNEELDAFAHTVAHDLKTPLTSIIGYADMLEKVPATLSQGDLQGSLRTIASNGRKMDNIIDKLLLLAGVRQTEKVEINPLDMAGIVAAALQRLADMIEEYQAEVILPASWPTALGYGPWVEEVWVNCISDAIKYGAQPPRIELGTTPEADDGVRFWVRGDGAGPVSEKQVRSSAPSERLAQAPAKEPRLGLFIVRRIMEKLGRKFTLEGTGDQGSTFSFTLREV